ncbi:hypothetical protein OAH18_00335 [bacterium]|nr:hypothetical protein [bacterium]
MIKKTLFGLLAMGLVATAILGKDACSYARTLTNNVREAVKGEVDVEFEVARAKDMVEQLVPDIRKCMEVVAGQQVDIRDMERVVTERQLAMNTQREAVLAMRSDLNTDMSEFTYANVSWTRGEVSRDLSRRFERLKAAESTLNADKKILAARREQLAANQDKLEGMMDQKQQLEVQVAQLEARLKQFQAAQTVAELKLDDSNLSRAQKLIHDLHKQLEVNEAMLDAEGKFTGLIPWDGKDSTESTDIAAEIDAYFGKGNDAELVADADTDPSA